MAFFRGEEGSVAFDNGSGTVGAIASTTAWTLDTTKDTLECTAHGDTSRKYVGCLISGSGTVELLYTATSGDNTAEIISDVLTTEDAGEAAFNLFLDFFLSISASAFLAPPLPLMKLFTLPIAHAAIGTLRDPEDKYAPCPLRYTWASCP